MPSKRKPHPLDSLTFEAPAPAPQPTVAPSTPIPAVPAPQEDPTRASNVTLPVSIWEWIDAKHAEARSAGGSAFRKSAIIRAVFLVAMSVDVDISGSKGDEEIAEKIISAIAQKDIRTDEQPHS